MPMGGFLLTKKSKRRDKISLKIIVKNVIMTRKQHIPIKGL